MEKPQYLMTIRPADTGLTDTANNWQIQLSNARSGVTQCFRFGTGIANIHGTHASQFKKDPQNYLCSLWRGHLSLPAVSHAFEAVRDRVKQKGKSQHTQYVNDLLTSLKRHLKEMKGYLSIRPILLDLHYANEKELYGYRVAYMAVPPWPPAGVDVLLALAESGNFLYMTSQQELVDTYGTSEMTDSLHKIWDEGRLEGSKMLCVLDHEDFLALCGPDVDDRERVVSDFALTKLSVEVLSE